MVIATITIGKKTTMQTTKDEAMTEPTVAEHNVVSNSPAPLFQPLRSSEKIDALAAALAKAQGAMRHPGKNKTAKVPMKTGGSYSYNYADLADVLDAIRAPFSANGLSMIQVPFNDGPNAIGICTRIMHSSGQWLEAVPLYMPIADTKAQTIGSAITYGRRYSAGPMAGIFSEDDDDGSAAQGIEAATGRRDRGTSTISNAEPSERVKKMLSAFARLGVRREQLEHHCGAPIDQIDLDSLQPLYSEIDQGRLKAADVGRG